MGASSCGAVGEVRCTALAADAVRFAAGTVVAARQGVKRIPENSPVVCRNIHVWFGLRLCARRGCGRT